jgi:HAD superfamily hydrolase (TIGR01549 family)
VSRFVKFREWHTELLGLDVDDEIKGRLSAEFDRLVEARIVRAPEIAGAHGALAALTGKLPLYIASATPDASLRRIVEERGMSGFFVGVHGTPTSKFDVLVSVAATHRCDRSQVLMVGDAESDRQAAEQAGTSFVGVVPADRADDRAGDALGASPHPWTAPGSGVVTISDLSTLTTLLL